MQKKFFLILLFSSLIHFTYGEVEPPNYDFSLDNLKTFFPGAGFEEIQKKWGKGEIAFTQGNAQVYRFYVDHIRYKFPVFTLIFENKSVAFYARLPSYFLHDVFLQSLHNRLGKQNEFSRIDNAAVYIWNNKEGIKYIYQGQCTITCWPMYFTGELVTPPAGLGGQTGILELFQVK